MSAPTLITGAGGFLGSHLLAALRARGEAARALDLSFPAPPPEGVERIEGSVLDKALMARAAEGTRAVIHCAAVADLWAPDVRVYERVNLEGTRAALRAAKGAGARLVHVSSYVTLVGCKARREPLDERVELPPEALLGPYPRSKRAGELAVLAGAMQGADAVVVQPSAPVGPGDRRMTPPSRMIRDLAAGRTPALIDTLVNLVDARALAEGVLAARDRGRSGERYLLTGEDLTMRDIAERVTAWGGASPPRFRSPLSLALAAARVEAGIAALTGRPPAAPLTGVRLAARRPCFSNAKARAELGFAPPPIDTALRDALAWMREEGLLAAPAPPA